MKLFRKIKILDLPKKEQIDENFLDEFEFHELRQVV
jgi:hypothetical protein